MAGRQDSGRYWRLSRSFAFHYTETGTGLCPGGGASSHADGKLRVETEIDYEGLPQEAATSTHMLAGAVAGIMEHCLMYPIDCVKTRMQSLHPEPGARYRNVMDALRQIVRTEGVWRPIRGVNVLAVGRGLHTRSTSPATRKSSSDSATPFTPEPTATSPTELLDVWHFDPRRHHEPGRSGEAAHADVQLPVPRRRALHLVAAAARGPRRLLPQLHHAAHHERPLPGAALHDLRVAAGVAQPSQTLQPLSHVVSGAMAGAIAAAATTPLDVCKTLLNTQEAQAVLIQAQGGSVGAGTFPVWRRRSGLSTERAGRRRSSKAFRPG
ncbi:hypothetical protein WMY93_005436 [Mugilogobius chulae]|uniref:Solute carrier family 25 member 28 n=1 Tax=Mugilogobius chulae TaxID=88201 RepID=A0AAW0PLH5_9GOBI